MSRSRSVTFTWGGAIAVLFPNGDVVNFTPDTEIDEIVDTIRERYTPAKPVNSVDVPKSESSPEDRRIQRRMMHLEPYDSDVECGEDGPIHRRNGVTSTSIDRWLAEQRRYGENVPDPRDYIMASNWSTYCPPGYLRAVGLDLPPSSSAQAPVTQPDLPQSNQGDTQ